MQLWWYGEELFPTRVAFWLMDSVLAFESTCSILNTIQNIHQSAPFFLHSGDAALHPDYVSTFLQADTHVSVVDVKHVNLCWRFNSLNACSVPTERERYRIKCQFPSLIRGKEKVQQFNPKALDMSMKKLATKWHFGIHVSTGFKLLYFMEMAESAYTASHQFSSTLFMEKRSISDLKTVFVHTVHYRLILYGSVKRVDLIFITSRSESTRSLSYSERAVQSSAWHLKQKRSQRRVSILIKSTWDIPTHSRPPAHSNPSTYVKTPQSSQNSAWSRDPCSFCWLQTELSPPSLHITDLMSSYSTEWQSWCIVGKHSPQRRLGCRESACWQHSENPEIDRTRFSEALNNKEHL